MVAFNVSVNQEQVRDAVTLFEFVGGNSDQALKVAINKTLPIVKTKASAAIRTKANLKAAYVRDKLGFVKASRQKLSGAIKAESRGLLLTHYDYKPRTSLIGTIVTPDSPIRVKVKPGAGQIRPVAGKASEVYGAPFYMRLQNSGAVGIGMWRRSPTPGGSRVKIFHSSSVSQIFTTVREEVTPEAADVLTNQMLDAMRYLLAKKYPPEA